LKQANLRRKWSTIPRATPAFQTISRHVSPCGGFLFQGLPLFEIGPVLAALDHVARFIANANHSSTGIFGSKVKLAYFV
jgi:hypothetical protein